MVRETVNDLLTEEKENTGGMVTFYVAEKDEKK